ncbi:FAD-dependent oxidoreductase [Cloacibacillus evryensis]|uniref:oxidoreductase n=1 Tax=Cloacibacillus evryensis TaxID=508460 RepID=UPI0021099C96|nr:FAD-dependent oxidoreductase [Cloacibacillus evryensis]MCQ4764913.1 FAD-dependent oxidoreductase [Cloacibacillus evryensis]
MKKKKLFAPIKICGVEVKNRLAMAPMGAFGLVDEYGCFNQRGIDYYSERAKGGTGLIISSVCKVENTVDAVTNGLLPCTDIDPTRFVLTASELTERVHSYGCKIFLQLSMGFGRVLSPHMATKHPVSASAVPNYWDPGVTCREMTTEEVEFVIDKFGQAAATAKRAGFDGVEIHAVHEGYLLDQFTMAFTNHRTDKFGGDLRGRLTLPCEIVKCIKGYTDERFPVILRYSMKSCVKGFNQGGLEGEEYVEVGRDFDEGLEAAKILADAGYDAFDADEGAYDAWYFAHPPVYQEHGLYLKYSEQLRRVIDKPVLVAGKLDLPEMAEEALETGKVDMVVLGRALLADPYWPKKVMEGREDEIVPCIGCHAGCMGRGFEGKHLSCAVNPACGRERYYEIKKIDAPKKAVVVGGGVAGMEAARVLSLRGYTVTLYEASGALGGNIIPGAVPDFKFDDRRLLDYYRRQMELLGVDVKLNTRADAEMLRQLKADAVILAVGATIKKLSVPCADEKMMANAVEVLLGEKHCGSRVVMVGGGLVGCETALWLAQNGKEVTVVEMLDNILASGKPVPHMNKDMLINLMKQAGVKVVTSSSLLEVTKEGAVVIDKKFRKSLIPADTVVMAAGFAPNNQLFKELYGEIGNLCNVGDSEAASNIMDAVWTANEVALNI